MQKTNEGSTPRQPPPDRISLPFLSPGREPTAKDFLEASLHVLRSTMAHVTFTCSEDRVRTKETLDAAESMIATIDLRVPRMLRAAGESLAQEKLDAARVLMEEQCEPPVAASRGAGASSSS